MESRGVGVIGVKRSLSHWSQRCLSHWSQRCLSHWSQEESESLELRGVSESFESEPLESEESESVKSRGV